MTESARAIVLIIVVLIVLLTVAAMLVWTEPVAWLSGRIAWAEPRRSVWVAADGRRHRSLLFKERLDSAVRRQAGVPAGSGRDHRDRAHGVRGGTLRAGHRRSSTSTSACCSFRACRRWASTVWSWRDGHPDNKYSLIGRSRATPGQSLGYEVFMGLSLMGVVMLAGSFSLGALSRPSVTLVLRPADSSVCSWFCDRGCGRDAAVSVRFARRRRERLVAGYHTEYSGMKFGMFFVGEYLGITLISALVVTLFFGGWLGPWFPADRLVRLEGIRLHLLLHPASGVAAAAAVRSAHGARLEGDVTGGAAGHLVVTGAMVVPRG